MWGVFLSPPDAKQVEQILHDGQRRGYNHPHVGDTEAPPGSLPHLRGWAIDHNRVQVGKGRSAFRRAEQALREWRQFDLKWARVEGQPPLNPGQGVAVVAKSLFAWTCNPLRVVYAKRDKGKLQLGKAAAGCGSGGIGGNGNDGSSNAGGGGGFLWFGGGGSRGKQQEVQGERFRFAHGTLGGHQLAGEERFAVEWHRADDSVWYEIYTFSRPATPLALLTYPLVRCYQGWFARESMAAMAREVQQQQQQQRQ